MKASERKEKTLELAKKLRELALRGSDSPLLAKMALAKARELVHLNDSEAKEEG